MSRCIRIFIMLVFMLVPVAITFFLPGEKSSIHFLTALLVGITAYYAWATYGQLEQQKETARSAIRPLIIATRFSKEGEIGAYAGKEGFNRIIHLVNVGSGHAHRVNIRISPPAEAYAVDDNGNKRSEGSIHVIHGVEMPKNSKRMWNNFGAFCSKRNWHYMYAEYEDMEGNQYYTMQSGYNVKTGRIKELNQNRKDDNDLFWKNEKQEDWLDNIGDTLKTWAQKQKETYEMRKR